MVWSPGTGSSREARIRPEEMAGELITLILAAGASRRMGKPKALLPWGKQTVLRHLLTEVQGSGPGEILLVTGAHREAIESEIPDGTAHTCHNPDWEQGMGVSLATGVRTLEHLFPDAGAALVMLVDQPLVTGAYLRMLRKEHQAYPDFLIASGYGGFAGVPAVFPKNFWAALKGLSADRGAKGLIQAHKDQCRVLEAGAAITDIDTPEAYRKALRQAGMETENKGEG